MHNSQISGNFTVGSDYVISGNLSPDLAFGLLGTRRLAHAGYMQPVLRLVLARAAHVRECAAKQTGAMKQVILAF